jgi:hypothetical protein
LMRSRSTGARRWLARSALPAGRRPACQFGHVTDLGHRRSPCCRRWLGGPNTGCTRDADRTSHGCVIGSQVRFAVGPVLDRRAVLRRPPVFQGGAAAAACTQGLPQGRLEPGSRHDPPVQLKGATSLTGTTGRKAGASNAGGTASTSASHHAMCARSLQADGSLGYATDLPLEAMYRFARGARIYAGPTRSTGSRWNTRSYAAMRRRPTRFQASTSRPAARLPGRSSRTCSMRLEQGLVDAADARMDEDDGSRHQVTQREAPTFGRRQRDRRQPPAGQVGGGAVVARRRQLVGPRRITHEAQLSPMPPRSPLRSDRTTSGSSSSISPRARL